MLYSRPVTTPPVGPRSHIDIVREAAAAKALATMNVDDADRRWREAIQIAIAAGERVVDIAAAAGVTRDRVYQIRDGRR